MTANIKTLIQFHDETNSPSQITLLANDEKQQLPTMSYLISSEDSEIYFAQTQSPTLWLNQNAARRYDPSSLDTMQRIDRREYGTDAYFRLSQFYCADVLAERSNSGPVMAPLTRPKAGSRWTLASAQEAEDFLSLVKSGPSIGQVAGVGTREGGIIAVRLNAEMLRHHVLAAGATGSGKSNTNVNLILTAQTSGFCTLVYDMKPDYSQIDQPNDEVMAGTPVGLKGVKFWALGASNRQPNETPISVRASDLDPAKLAQVIFYRPGEENQQEMAEQLMNGYADLQNDKSWSIADFIDWLMNFADAPAAEAVMPFRVVFNKQTFNALRGKITRAGRIPSWIDAGVFARGGARQAFGGSGGKDKEVAADQLFMQLAAKSVHVIRVRAEADGRSYALFLDYAMRKVADMRRDQSETTPPIMHLIDEAADLFKSSNRRLAQAMEGTIDEQVRKGRSLSIGFVLSAQSAGDIPERIRHNLNSVIVFRHHQPKILQEVLPIMSDAVREMASKLQPGEALVQLFKTFGLLRCRMYQSPARLYKPTTNN